MFPDRNKHYKRFVRLLGLDMNIEIPKTGIEGTEEARKSRELPESTEYLESVAYCIHRIWIALAITGGL